MGDHETDDDEALGAYSASIVRVVDAVLPAVLRADDDMPPALTLGDAATLRIIDELVRTGRVRRAWLGIAGAPVVLPEPVAGRVGSRTGIRVAQVIARSPADLAGIRTGDILVAIDGAPVVTTTEVQRLMVGDAIGRRTEVTVWRNGALVDAVLLPEELTQAR